MKINGREIADEIFQDLKTRVEALKVKNITPHLHIITLTVDQASNAYVSQKVKRGEEIGAKITDENLDPSTPQELLLEKIVKLNSDPAVHGIIIQRPFSSHIDEEEIANSINPEKDVDGFHPGSKFSPPIAEAVLKILEKVFNSQSSIDNRQSFSDWLKSKKIAVVGRGVTAGAPVINTLKSMDIDPQVVTSKTENKSEILKESDIIIGAVGKLGLIRGSDIKKGSVLVGVGMFRGDDGKFHSDYEEDEIKDIASYYTPTPGGVGPVNVAMLLSNLLKATEKQSV